MTGRFRAGKRLWEPEDDRRLREIYPDLPTAVVAAQLGRSIKATYARAKWLGVTKSTEFFESPAAYRIRQGDRIGRATEFPKGHVPANKGLRRPGYSVGRGRMQSTQFKKGQLNGVAARRVHEIGSTRWVEGYLYRKVSAHPGPWTRNWTMEHVLVWTAAHGPVPAGHCIVFRNKDHADTRLDNLELISRRDLMARNTVHNLPAPLPQTIQLLGALKRQIRRKERARA